MIITVQESSLWISFKCRRNIRQAVGDPILNRIKQYALDSALLHGQGYDGAGNIASKVQGCAACSSWSYPEVACVHSKAHVLNLCRAKACELPTVQNVIWTLNQGCLFSILSPNGKLLLNKVLVACQCLKLTCEKLWWINAGLAGLHGMVHINVFTKRYVAVVETFEEIGSPSSQQTWKNNTVTTANSLKLAIYSGSILFVLLL